MAERRPATTAVSAWGWVGRGGSAEPKGAARQRVAVGALQAVGVELSRRIESAVFEDLPGRRFDKRAERVLGAVTALAGHTEFVLQLFQGSDTARRRGADLPVGDAATDANVHVRVARLPSIDKISVVRTRTIVNSTKSL